MTTERTYNVARPSRSGLVARPSRSFVARPSRSGPQERDALATNRGPTVSVWLLACLLTCLPACTFTDGDPWGTVEPRLQWTQPLDALVGHPDVTIDPVDAPVELALVEVTSSTAGGGPFDPADPPPGYSLCHGGHCHHESGELVSYDDVRADLQSGGGASETTLASASGRLGLLEPSTASLERTSVDKQATISKTRITSPTVSMEGTLQRDGQSFPLEVNLGEVALAEIAALGLTIGPDAPEHQKLTLCARWDDGWFEDVDLDALEQRDGRILISRIVNLDASRKIRESLANGSWTQGGCSTN